ncbi:carbohydrate-binding module family 1 protein [Plenodomus tracheiphilus IPT5]|uniref:AA9 family lytic polysaccharide monooxygenase n=1 Tax=Plenodomus tracheiphilus IPT5 TaxID=1408161 RepID=A0A6A7BIZ1_9PLEO|nr:carbohydrate-binding module family 1 protein [Plenodomus tracheiphilus IPT5]
MKTAFASIFFGVLAVGVSSHATWQDLRSTCARLPTSNSPVTDLTSNNMRCKANQGVVASNDATADGSSTFFKIFEDTWAKNSASGGGSDDFWGTKDLNANCGRMDVKMPANLAPGDYLLRAEAIALHSASGIGGAQSYMTCCQLTITGSGTSNPAGLSFPEAYKATDPGIPINIYQRLASCVAPGSAVIADGTEAVAGSKPGSVVTVTGGVAQPTATIPLKTSSAQAAPTNSGGAGGCTAAKYQQCGGTGYKGCTICAAGSTCNAQSGGYYSLCI